MFKITEGKVTIENEERITYGIRYNDEYYMDDVSVDMTKVRRMVDMFNRLDLSPCQLYDAVEDMIE